jgi:hypothetical protein
MFHNKILVIAIASKVLHVSVVIYKFRNCNSKNARCCITKDQPVDLVLVKKLLVQWRGPARYMSGYGVNCERTRQEFPISNSDGGHFGYLAFSSFFISSLTVIPQQEIIFSYTWVQPDSRRSSANYCFFHHHLLTELK